MSIGGGANNGVASEVINDLDNDTNNGGNKTNNNTNNSSTNVGVNNSSTSVTTNKITPQTFEFKEDEIAIAKGSGEINFSYTPNTDTTLVEPPDEPTTSGVAYQYRFNNSMDVDMAVNLKSISTTSVTLSYAYSDTELTNVTSSNTVFECQRISPNATKYIYIVVTPTSTRIPSSFSSSVVFYQGVAGTLDIICEGETLSTQTIVKGQQVAEPVIEVPDGYEFQGLYFDSSYSNKVEFPLRTQNLTIYIKLKSGPNLPSDYLAWDGEKGCYYICQGSSSLPSDLVVPETYNDGTHGDAYVLYMKDYDYFDDLEGCFCGASILSVTLPETITNIGEGAFAECEDLISIDLSKCVNLTSIGSNAFSYSAITNIDLTNCINLETFKGAAFSDCGIKNINLHNCKKLASIDGAFSSCLSLQSIDLSNNIELTTIGANTFYYCQSITSVVLPESITSIGKNAFSNCFYLENINLPLGIDSIGAYAFRYCRSIPSMDLNKHTKLTVIDKYVFHDCENLSSVILPSSITLIDMGAFSGTNLTTITIPASVTRIAPTILSFCDNLTSVVFEDTSTWYETSNSDYTGGNEIDVSNPTAKVSDFSHGWLDYLYKL